MGSWAGSVAILTVGVNTVPYGQDRLLPIRDSLVSKLAYRCVGQSSNLSLVWV
jgi:hypothetical protein